MSVPRLRVSALILALGAVCAFFFPTTAALAHDSLIDSSPAAQETLTEVPDEITLVYSAELTAVGTTVLLTDAAGTNLLTADPVVSGDSVQVAVPRELPAGEYLVQWRVVSSDGHPITGEVPFTLELAAGAAAPETELETELEPELEPAAEPATETAAPVEAEPTSESTVSPAPAATHNPTSGANPAAVWIVIAGSVFLVVWMARRRSSAGPGFQD